MKKRISALLLALVMTVGLLPAGALAAEKELPFQDLAQDAWYLEAVRYAYETGMMSGVGDNNFAPDEATTRAMVVTLLHRLENAPGEKGETFTDVAADAWYAPAVAWASAKGIVKGVGEGQFLPNGIITREQFATILYRYAGFKGLDVTEKAELDRFPDAGEVSDFAKEAMAWAVKNGLINGTDGGLLQPLGSATRAQAAAILMRYRTTVGTAAATPTPTPTRKPSGGSGGGSGSGSGSSQTPIALAALTYNGGAVPEKGAIGGKLAVTVQPEGAQYDTQWSVTSYTYSVNADTKLVISAETFSKYEEYNKTSQTYAINKDTKVYTAETYEITAADAGTSISATVTGTGNYSGSQTTETLEVEFAKTVIPEGEDVARVTVAQDAAYKDESGNPVEVTETSVLSLTIEKTGDAASESDFGVGDDADAKKASLVSVLATAAGVEAEELDGFEDLTGTGSAFTQVEVELKLTTTGEGESEETVVHPVGDTYVLLTPAEAGVTDSNANLDDYLFFAQHTNKDDQTELVPGKVVTVEGKQYIQFKLNGLSRIWIGNVPPQTVTFDADGGAPTPAAQKVKFGGYAKAVEAPVKEGYLFAGWDHDVQSENIIQPITVKALWVEGKTAEDTQLTGTWSAQPEEGTVTETTANGVRTITLVNANGYTPNLTYTLAIAAPSGAVKFAAATTAQGALEATEYKTVADNAGDLAITQPVTDNAGKPVSSSTNLYVKWVDAQGKVLMVQSMTLTIGDADNYDTQTRKETFDVDRGLGRVSLYLTGGKGTAANASANDSAAEVGLPDYEGNVNAYLVRHGEEELYLSVQGSFSDSFYSSEVKGSITPDNYADVKVVVAPFEGESFSAAPAVTASYDANSTSDQPLAANAVLENGNVVVTCQKPKDATWITITLTLGEKSQEIDISIHSSSGFSYAEAQTWEEALELLNAGKSVRYSGTEDVTLTTALTLKPDQRLNITSASMTIGQGGVLTLEADDVSGSTITMWERTFVVDNGGVLAANTQDDKQSIYHIGGVSAGEIIVKNGGKIQVPNIGYMGLRGDTSGISLEAGSVVTSLGNLHLWSEVELAGTVTVSGEGNRWTRVEAGNGMTITSDGKVTVETANARFNVFGGLTNAGTVTLNAGDCYLSGASVNSGTITVNAGASLTAVNMGYCVENKGTITVNGTAAVNGTVLVNSGTISGSGSLLTGELDNAENAYDEVNGVEYVEVSSNRAPDNYSHYKFTADPATTVEATIFVGELSNVGEGSCTVN